MTNRGPRKERIFFAPFAAGEGGSYNNSPQGGYNNQQNRGNSSGPSEDTMHNLTPSGEVQTKIGPQGGYNAQGVYPAHCRFGSLLQSPTGGFSQNANQQQALFPNRDQNGYAATAVSPGPSTINTQEQSPTQSAFNQQQALEQIEAMRRQMAADAIRRQEEAGNLPAFNQQKIMDYLEVLQRQIEQVAADATRRQEEACLLNSEMRKFCEEAASAAKIKDDKTAAENERIKDLGKLVEEIASEAKIGRERQEEQHKVLLASVHDVAANIVPDVATNTKAGDKGKRVMSESSQAQGGNTDSESRKGGLSCLLPEHSSQRTEPDQVWMGGLPIHFDIPAVEKAVNNAVLSIAPHAGKCIKITRLYKQGSVLVILPHGVSKADVIKLDGRTDFYGFKTGRNPGLHVREVVAPKGGVAARTEGPRPQGNFGTGFSPVADSQRRPEGGRDWSRPEVPRPSAERTVKRGGGPKALATMGPGNEGLLTPAGAAKIIFEEKPDLSKESFLQRLLVLRPAFSLNQQGNAFKRYQKSQGSLEAQVDSSSRPSAGQHSAPPPSPRVSIPPMAKRGSESVSAQHGPLSAPVSLPNSTTLSSERGSKGDSRMIEERDPGESVEELKHLDSLNPQATPTVSQPPANVIGSAGGDVDKRSASAKKPVSETPKHTKQEIDKLFCLDGEIFRLGANGLDLALKDSGEMTVPVLAEGDCFYLSVGFDVNSVSDVEDCHALKANCKAHFEQYQGRIIGDFLSNGTLNRNEAKTFSDEYLKHITTDRSEAVQSSMMICAQAMNTDIELLDVTDGKSITVISGKRAWDRKDEARRKIRVGFRKGGSMVYGSDYKPIIDSEGKVLRAGGHCWAIVPFLIAGAAGNGQEWTDQAKGLDGGPL